MDNSLKSLEYDSTESYADYGGTAQQNHSSDILKKKKKRCCFLRMSQDQELP